MLWAFVQPQVTSNIITVDWVVVLFWNGFDFYKRILGHPDEINAKEI
jgi:hypothetical protein